MGELEKQVDVALDAMRNAETSFNDALLIMHSAMEQMHQRIERLERYVINKEEKKSKIMKLKSVK